MARLGAISLYDYAQGMGSLLAQAPLMEELITVVVEMSDKYGQGWRLDSQGRGKKKRKNKTGAKRTRRKPWPRTTIELDANWIKHTTMRVCGFGGGCASAASPPPRVKESLACHDRGLWLSLARLACSFSGGAKRQPRGPPALARCLRCRRRAFSGCA